MTGRRLTRLATALAASLFLLGTGEARAASPAEELQPANVLPPPTLGWAAASLIPSPGVLMGEEGSAIDLRWQLTPFLYSFALREGITPVRLFVVEPLVRVSGSIELYVSPEYLSLAEDVEGRFGARFGVRAYAPLYHGGEYLAASIGSSFLYMDGRGSAAIEAGVYVFYGLVGAQIAYSPTLAGRSVLSTLSLRYF